MFGTSYLIFVRVVLELWDAGAVCTDGDVQLYGCRGWGECSLCLMQGESENQAVEVNSKNVLRWQRVSSACGQCTIVLERAQHFAKGVVGQKRDREHADGPALHSPASQVPWEKNPNGRVKPSKQ
eukprot:6127496-Amphidinium_carterae.1